jgi:hypothetical protein
LSAMADEVMTGSVVPEGWEITSMTSFPEYRSASFDLEERGTGRRGEVSVDIFSVDGTDGFIRVTLYGDIPE